MKRAQNTIRSREEGLHMFDDFLVDPFDPLDPVAYMIYKDVMKDDADEDDEDNW